MAPPHLTQDNNRQDFGLIETMRWTRAIGFELLPEHLERLAGSSAVLGFAYDEARVRAALDAAVNSAAQQSAPTSVWRVRLVLHRHGAVETSVTPIEAQAADIVWRVALAQKRFASDDPRLRHKTTRRALYEDELAAATKRCGADEVIFRNERDEICEAARCNVFLQQGDLFLTPPLACGLLPGTLRAHLLATGRAREQILRLDDLRNDFRLGNSVRGLMRARLI